MTFEYGALLVAAGAFALAGVIGIVHTLREWLRGGEDE